MAFDIENTFKYHSPNPGQQVSYAQIRSEAKQLAECIDSHCPESREKSVAFTKLQEVVMFANASIAIHGQTVEVK